ncbi:MAG: DUF642 domain-containing protein [Aestuariivirga sp.]
MTKRLISLILASIGASALIAAMPAASATLVVNGGFQAGVPDFSGDEDRFEQVDAGDNTTLPGWTVGPGNVDWIHGYWEGSSGNLNDYSVDLSGSANGTIWQTITGLVTNQWYELTFDVATNFDMPAPQSLIFSFAGGIGGILGSADGTTHPNDSWTTYTIPIQWWGGSDTAVLLFASAGSVNSGCCWGPALDNVALNAVPLPAALPLFAAGLGAMGFFASRRRRKAAPAA